MSSFYTSLNGLRNAETDLGVIAHNIANAETVGFKKSTAQFADLVATGSATDPRRSPGIGATIAGITQDFVLGPLEQTGRSLDMAQFDSVSLLRGADGLFGAGEAGGVINFTYKRALAQRQATGDGVTRNGVVRPVDATGIGLATMGRHVAFAVQAEAHGQVEDRDDRAAQVHHTDDIGRRMRDRRGRRPAADFADSRRLDAEFLIMKPEGDDLEGLAAEAGGADSCH